MWQLENEVALHQQPPKNNPLFLAAGRTCGYIVTWVFWVRDHLFIPYIKNMEWWITGLSLRAPNTVFRYVKNMYVNLHSLKWSAGGNPSCSITVSQSQLGNECLVSQSFPIFSCLVGLQNTKMEKKKSVIARWLHPIIMHMLKINLHHVKISSEAVFC